MTWLGNVWQWIVANINSIVSGITIANLITWSIALVQLYKQRKDTKDNTTSSNVLNSTLQNVNNAGEELEDIDNNLQSNTDTINTLSCKYDELLNKIDAILDVQSIVYSTINDDTIRTNVQNLLTTAKLYKTKIENVKAKYENVAKSVTENVNTVKATVKEETTAVVSKVKEVIEDTVALRG